MASHLAQPSPPSGLHLHHGPPISHPQVNGHMPTQGHHKITPQHLTQLNETVWLIIGMLRDYPNTSGDALGLISVPGNASELQGDLDGAVGAYEQALRHNQYSIQAMNSISCILRTKEHFPRAVEYLNGILKLDASNGEVWGSLGKKPDLILSKI